MTCPTCERVAYLYVLGPSTRCQLTLNLEFSELSEVVRVLDTPRPQSVPDGKGHVVLVADVQDFVPASTGREARHGFNLNFAPGMC